MHSVASQDEPALKPKSTADPPMEVDPIHGAVGWFAGENAVATGILGAT